jgi:PAS domain S-box-containing protein
MNSETSLETRLRRLGVVCFAGVAVLGAGVALAWRLGQPRVGVFHLAGVTLILSLGLSLASWLTLRDGNVAAAKWLGRLIGLGVLALDLSVCARFLSGERWPGEAWLAGLLAPPDGVAPPMSRTAAFGFLLAGLAWLAQSHPAMRRRGWRQVAAVLALMEMLMGLVLLLCYLLQSDYHASIAFLGAVGLLLLGAGLVLTAGPDLWPVRLFLPPTTEERTRRRFGEAMLHLALLLAVMVLATGQFYSASQQATARLAAWRALATVADLKAAQIADWWNERLADAKYMRRTPYVARRALDVLDVPRTEERTEEMFRDWLEGLSPDKPIEQVLLLDEQLQIRLTHPRQSAGQLTDAERRAAREAARTKEVVAADLERPAAGEPVELSFVVPLVVRRVDNSEIVPPPGTGVLPADRTRGLLVLRVNAQKTLFPMLASWPTPSATSETVLLRRDGDAAVVLNPLRSGTNTALTVRVPVDRSSLETRSVLRGGKPGGELKGLDYRNVPALGVWRRVSNTPWVVLAKVDAAEINAPIIRQAWTTAGLVGLLVGVALLGVALLERQRHLVSIRRELLLERQRRAAEQKFHTLFESSRDAILLLEGGRFYDCNQAALELFGCATRDQFIGRHLADFSPARQADGADSRVAAAAHLQAAHARGVQFFEWLHRRRDGAEFPAEVLLSRIELDGRTVIQGVVRDITERKRAEAALLEISDREQARIGHDLHDGLCQHLVVTAFAANSLEQRLADRGAPETHDARQIASLLDDAITQARNTARGLFPVQLEAEGLASALGELAANVQRRTGVACALDYPAPVSLRDNATATQLYRIAQEAVNNAVKHGQPQHIIIRLLRTGEQVELTVLDDGVGIAEPPPGNGGMGLSIMEYRARTIGGTFKIQRRPEGGTAVSCFVRETPATDPGESSPEEPPPHATGALPFPRGQGKA